MSDEHRPRRPAMMSPAAMEAFGGTVDPMQEIEAAHQTAAVLVHAGRSAHDPTVTARLVDLVEELGLSTVADLWAHRPARTLPGALWRLYVLREWVRRGARRGQPRLPRRVPVRGRRPCRGRGGGPTGPGGGHRPGRHHPGRRLRGRPRRRPGASRCVLPGRGRGTGGPGRRGRRRPPAPPTSWTPRMTSRPPPRSGGSESSRSHPTQPCGPPERRGDPD